MTSLTRKTPMKRSRPLTEKQQAVLDYIKGYMAERGCPPTTYEIAHAFGWKSDNAAQEHLKALQKKGFIKLARGTTRGIRVVGHDPIAEKEEMASALRVIATWAQCDALNPADVLALCNKALKLEAE